MQLSRFIREKNNPLFLFKEKWTLVRDKEWFTE